MKPDLDLIRSLTDALDESLGGLRELLDDIECVDWHDSEGREAVVMDGLPRIFPA